MNSDLTTLANVHAWLPIPVTTTSEDPLLSRLITATSMDFQRATRRPDLLTASYVEARIGDGSGRMTLRHWPITAVTAVKIAGVTVAPSADQIAAGYYIDAAVLDPELCFELFLSQLQFTDGAQVVVSYAGGYTAVPGDVEQAVIDWVVYRYKGRPNVSVSRRSAMEGRGIGDTAEVQEVDAPQTTQAVIARYLRKVPSLDRRGDRAAMQMAQTSASSPRR